MIEWQGLDEKGFAPFSRAFMQNYRHLNITMEEAMLIMHLLDHSWLGKREFPSAKFFADVTGKSDQTIRMYLRSLSFKGYLVAVKNDKGRKTYDWSPLLEALRSIAGVPSSPEVEPIEVESQPVQGGQADSDETDALKELLDASLSLVKDARFKRAPVQATPKHWQRLKSFTEKTPEQYNANDIELVMARAWHRKGWKTPAPRFTMRDRKHSKDLITAYGPDVVAKVIDGAISSWESLAPKLRLNNAYPSMGIMYGYRNSIFPLMIDGDPNNGNPSWGSHFDRNKDSSPEGEEKIGW